MILPIVHFNWHTNLSKGLLLALFTCLISFSYANENASDLYLQGNEAYKDGKFQQAVELYNASYKEKPHYNTAYNLGNAYMKIGKIGSAILYYKKALKEKPEFPVCEDNLKLASERIIDKVDVAPRQRISAFWVSLKQSVGVSTFSIMGIVFLFLACSGALIYVVIDSKNLKKLGFYSAIAAFAISLTSIFFAMSTVNDINNEKEGVLLVSNQNVLTSPSNSGDLAFVIHEGTSFQVLQFQDGFAEIKLTNGSIGWLPNNAFSLV